MCEDAKPLSPIASHTHATNETAVLLVVKRTTRVYTLYPYRVCPSEALFPFTRRIVFADLLPNTRRPRAYGGTNEIKVDLHDGVSRIVQSWLRFQKASRHDA